MTKGTGRLDLFTEQLKAFTRGAKRIDDGDVEAVHRVRVASRRLRELLPVLGLESSATDKFDRRLKKVTRRLGDVRELDVQMMIIEELGHDPRISSSALARMTTAVHRDRAASRDRLHSKLPFDKIRQLARRLRRAVEPRQEEDERQGHQLGRRPAQRHAWLWAVDARVARRAAGVRSAIETAGGMYVPERLHEVRLAVKKLRYAMELGAAARRQRETRDIAALKTAQDLLGRLHDLDVLIERARQEQASQSPPSLVAWRELDSLIDSLEEDCRALHGRYMQQRATLVAIADRMHQANVDRRAMRAVAPRS
jgi:CHAD domain-containing protein